MQEINLGLRKNALIKCRLSLNNACSEFAFERQRDASLIKDKMAK